MILAVAIIVLAIALYFGLRKIAFAIDNEKVSELTERLRISNDALKHAIDRTKEK